MGGIGSGGFRENAGRKTLDGIPRSKISISIPSDLLDDIRRIATSQNQTLSEHITNLIKKGARL